MNLITKSSLILLCYIVFAQILPFSETGAAEQAKTSNKARKVKASYYGETLKGKKTASGEKFNPNDQTAAHKTLPLGTKVLVKNAKNGKETVVKINDRGPYAKGREIDLSKSAAEKLDIRKKGVQEVQIQVIETPIAGCRNKSRKLG
jgi:rare lipoprotein A